MSFTQSMKCQELFDENMLKMMMNDDRISIADRKKLKSYQTGRIAPGKKNIVYTLSKGCSDDKLGRLYAGDGLQNFRGDLRSALIQKYYWDIDMENCSYRILLKMAEDLHLSPEAIRRYVYDREACLKMMSDDRKVAKTALLKTLFLGNVQLYKEDYEEVDGEILEQGQALLTQISHEINILATILWDRNPTLHKLKTGQDNKPINTRRNPKASLMSLLYQTEECKLLLIMKKFFEDNHRTMSLLIHDGGGVQKIDQHETQFPPELLIACAAKMRQDTGYDIVLAQKQIVHQYAPSLPSEDAYTNMKTEFEQHTFVVGTQLFHIMPNGATQFIKYHDALFKFAPLRCDVFNAHTGKIVNKPFLEMWKDDPKRLAYESVDFFPNPTKCPASVYNLFRGFNAEKYMPQQPMTNEEILELVKPIRHHIASLCENKVDLVLKWMANIVQHPDRKSETSILIRDQGNLLMEGGGTGKNVLLEFFGYQILGEQYSIIVGDNREMFSSFNSMFEGKLLVFVEEASGKDNHSNNDMLKSKITSKTTNINKKSVAQYSVNDYSNYIFSSNNRNPLPIKSGDRRFWVFDASTNYRGNVKYFTDLANHLERDDVKWAFYQYLLQYTTFNSPIEFSVNTPITQGYKDIRYLNSPMHVKWLIHVLREGELFNGMVYQLHSQFLKWMESDGETKNDKLSITAFGLLFSNTRNLNLLDMRDDDVISPESEKSLQKRQLPTDLAVIKKRKVSGVEMQWNVNELVKSFKSQHLLEDDFEYVHKAHAGHSDDYLNNLNKF